MSIDFKSWIGEKTVEVLPIAGDIASTIIEIKEEYKELKENLTFCAKINKEIDYSTIAQTLNLYVVRIEDEKSKESYIYVQARKYTQEKLDKLNYYLSQIGQKNISLSDALKCDKNTFDLLSKAIDEKAKEKHRKESNR